MKADGKDYKKPNAATSLATSDKPRTLGDWLEESKDKFLGALPQGTIDVARFLTAASMEISSNPKIMACDRKSIQDSLLMAARYGVEVGPLLGQGWLIPYNESKQVEGGAWKKVMTCHFQLGYKGLIVLARRSNTIKTISCEVVYENDFFDVELGMGRTLTHKPNYREVRGAPIAYYCLVELENGGVQFGVMSKKDIENHRDTFSKGYDPEDKNNIWVKNFDAMALKTVAIRALKLCPISVEALEAVGREERMEADLRDVTPRGTTETVTTSGLFEQEDNAREKTTPPSSQAGTEGVDSKKRDHEPTDAELAAELAEGIIEPEFPEPPDPDDAPGLF